MDIGVRIFRFLYRRKWWLICFPVIAILATYNLTKDLPRVYTSNTVIYTGVISGYNLESSISQRIDLAQTNNQMENFLNIIRSYSTLQNVSLKLYAQHMTYGDTIADTKYISASHFAPIYHHAPESVKALIDKSSSQKTFDNFKSHIKNEYDNYLYGIFMWNYGYYGKGTLEEIKVSRIKTSDMIEISYTNNDPNVVYNTLLLLSEEFLEQYSIIRDQEAEKAIEYYQDEMERVGRQLRAAEDEQKRFSIDNKVINYDEQTKQLANIQGNFNVRIHETKLALKSSQVIIEEMEKKFGTPLQSIKENEEFLNKIKSVSSLSNQISISSIFQNIEEDDNSGKNAPSASIYALNRDLSESEKDLRSYVDNYYQLSGTGEVLLSKEIAREWLNAVITNEKAKEELIALETIQRDISDMYATYSPIGIYLKQQDRMITFLEDEYSSLQNNLNEAKLRKKNIQMSTANLKILTPPQLPLAAEPTKRKYYVAGAGAGTFIFILGIFIFMEIIGRTLRDRERAERITGGKVIVAMPKRYKFRYKKYNEEFYNAAIRHLSNNILSKVRYREMNIVNIISLSPKSGKSDISRRLTEQWNKVGRKYRYVNWLDALNRRDREIMFPINFDDILSLGPERIVLIEHRDLNNDIIQKEILQNAVINVLVLDSTTSWKDTDRNNYNNLVEQLGPNAKSLFICLTNVGKYVVEEFTDQLPPYNIFANLSHDIYNFGNTSGRR